MKKETLSDWHLKKVLASIERKENKSLNIQKYYKGGACLKIKNWKKYKEILT